MEALLNYRGFLYDNLGWIFLFLVVLFFVFYYFHCAKPLRILKDKVDSIREQVRTVEAQSAQGKMQIDEIMSQDEELSQLWRDYSKTLTLVNHGNNQSLYYSTVDAEDYFYRGNVAARINVDFWQNVGSIFTGLGILGIFFGGTLRCMEANSTSNNLLALQETGKNLLGGINLAFLSAVVGIVATVGFYAVHKRWWLKPLDNSIRDLATELNRKYPLKSAEMWLADVMSVNNQQISCLNALSRQFATEIGKALDRRLSAGVERVDGLSPALAQVDNTLLVLNGGDTNSAADNYCEVRQEDEELQEDAQQESCLGEATNRESAYYKEVIVNCTRAIEQDEEDTEAYQGRGNAYSALGRYEEALADYSKALELDPEFYYAYSKRGLAYEKLQRYEEALADYTKACELRPSFAKAQASRERAQRLIWQSRAGEAKQNYEMGLKLLNAQKYTAAIELFAMALELNPEYVEAYCSRGQAYEKCGEYTKAQADYAKVLQLEPDNALAQSKVEEERQRAKEPAILLKQGKQAVENKAYAKAEQLFKQAAELGAAEAMFWLGFMYENGYGVSKDYSQAYEWYQKAAALGNADARCNLGWLYKNGYGVTKDYSQAYRQFEKAAELGNACAMRRLGVLYYSGQGVAQDYGKAATWFKQAAELGDADARCWLGILYQNGQGVAQDYGKAATWFKQAAELGDADAMFWLGVLYYNGQGVTQDYKQSYAWFKQAADLGHADAAEQLQEIAEERGQLEEKVRQEKAQKAAILLKQGKQAVEDKAYEKAERLFKQAAEMGDAEAAEQLKELAEQRKKQLEEEKKGEEQKKKRKVIVAAILLLLCAVVSLSMMIATN